jgi:hypothetical protein
MMGREEWRAEVKSESPLGQISIKHALWIQKISAHDVVQETMLNAAVSATVGHFLLALHEKEEEARETRPLM